MNGCHIGCWHQHMAEVYATLSEDPWQKIWESRRSFLQRLDNIKDGSGCLNCGKSTVTKHGLCADCIELIAENSGKDQVEDIATALAAHRKGLEAATTDSIEEGDRVSINTGKGLVHGEVLDIRSEDTTLFEIQLDGGEVVYKELWEIYSKTPPEEWLATGQLSGDKARRAVATGGKPLLETWGRTKPSKVCPDCSGSGLHEGVPTSNNYPAACKRCRGYGHVPDDNAPKDEKDVAAHVASILKYMEDTKYDYKDMPEWMKKHLGLPLEPKSEIDLLADFIVAEVEDEPSKNEGAGTCAIRIIKQLQAELTEAISLLGNDLNIMECSDWDDEKQLCLVKGKQRLPSAELCRRCIRAETKRRAAR